MTPNAVKTVLYVEDNAVNVYLVQAIFADRTDIRLLTATSGASGLALAEMELPRMILLDLQLPDMAGEEFLCRLRAESSTAVKDAASSSR